MLYVPGMAAVVQMTLLVPGIIYLLPCLLHAATAVVPISENISTAAAAPPGACCEGSAVVTLVATPTFKQYR